MEMTGPGWLGWLFAAVMLGTAAYCAGRLAVAWRSRRPTGYAVDLTHILMGSAMAGMLVPGLGFAPAGLWRATFAAAGCWFAAQAVRGLTRGGPARAGLTAGGPASATAGSQAANVPADGGSARRSWIPGSPIHGGPVTVQGWPGATGHTVTGPFVHLLACGAMLVMLAAPASGAGTAARAAGGTAAAGGPLPVLAILCAVGLLASVVLATDRLTVLAPVSAGTQAPGVSAAVPMSLRLAACCDIAVGVTMGYLLILMIA